MLQRRYGFIIKRMIALQAFHQLGRQRPREVRIFAIGLLRPPPPRVPFHINGWRPDRQAVNRRVPLKIHACLIADHRADLTHQLGIPGTGQPCILRKRRRFP
ncbi:hypothetical protein D3C81_1239830 [compost metagenome]